MRAELRQAIRAAGDLALQHFGSTDIAHADRKGAGDFVSFVDRRVQDELIIRLKKKFPDHHYVGEEDERHDRPVTGPHWIIDPIDGTTNFLRGIPAWTISVCFCADIDRPKMAAILDPVHGDLYEAEHSAGAWRNGARLHTSNCQEPNAALWASALPFRFPDALPQVLEAFATVQADFQDLRRSGSAAYDLALLASGRIDAYWEPFIYSWDVAAGELLVREAGGIVTDFRGQTAGLLQRRSIVAAASAELHQRLAAMCTPLATTVERLVHGQ